MGLFILSVVLINIFDYSLLLLIPSFIFFVQFSQTKVG